MKKIIIVFMALLVVVLGVNTASVSAQNSLADIQEKGEIIMGTSADFPPFEWVVMQDGEPQEVGIDIDLAQMIADEIGVDLIVENTSFDSLIAQVQSGKVDMVLAGMTYTEERANAVDFSETYYETNSKFVVPAGQEGNYSEVTDFETATIGVQKGTIQESTAREMFPDAEIISMNRNGDLVESLKSGRVEAVLMDGIVVQEFVAQNEGEIVLLEDIQVETDSEGFAVVTAKGNTELMDVINSVITEAVESGQIQEIFEANTQLNAETQAELEEESEASSEETASSEE